jgi:hypothetical protein
MDHLLVLVFNSAELIASLEVYEGAAFDLHTEGDDVVLRSARSGSRQGDLRGRGWGEANRVSHRIERAEREAS